MYLIQTSSGMQRQIVDTVTRPFFGKGNTVEHIQSACCILLHGRGLSREVGFCASYIYRLRQQKKKLLRSPDRNRFETSQTARGVRDDTKSSMTCTWLQYAGYAQIFDRRQESLQRIQKKPRAQVENKKVFTQQPLKSSWKQFRRQGLPTMLALMNRRSMTRGWR